MGQQLFVTDFDGTLLNDNKAISRKDFYTLRTLKNRNVIITVATGRSIYLFKKALFSMGVEGDPQKFPVDYVVFSTGAGIMEFPATQVLGILPGRKTPDRIDTIRHALPDFSVIQATSPLDHKSSWIEVFHKDVSKSKAVSWLSNRLKIKKEDVISVGNDYNDEDLLSWSGQAYVVNNAPDSLKRKFKNVLSNNHSGITNAVDVSGLFPNK